MRIVLDHCVPARLAAMLIGHEVSTAVGCGWAGLRNGDLLAAAATAGFDALLTVDRNLPHQQNLDRLPLAVIVLRAVSNDVNDLRLLVPLVLVAIATLPLRTLVITPPE